MFLTLLLTAGVIVAAALLAYFLSAIVQTRSGSRRTHDVRKTLRGEQ